MRSKIIIFLTKTSSSNVIRKKTRK